MIAPLADTAPLLRTPALRAIESAAHEQPLMERAGEAAARQAMKLSSDDEAPILVVAGPGNNGGDALVAARLLRQRNLDVFVVFAGDPARLPADAANAHAAFVAAGGEWQTAIPARQRWSLVIDGLFGIGLQRPIHGHLAQLIADVEAAAAASRCPLLALDCPSGLDADTGQRLGACVHASHTLTFIAAKPGLLTGAGPDHCGLVEVATLGIDLGRGLESLVEAADHGRIVGVDLFAEHLRRRPRDSHKGSFGSTGVLGGANGMAGAALLAGRAALKLGAGRVFVGFAGSPPVVDPVQPELMLRDCAGCLAAPLTALACGPGLGTGDAAKSVLTAALARNLPLVLDADALTLIAGDDDLRVALATRASPTALTPHPAEAARLLASDAATVQRDRIAAAREIATAAKSWVALKGVGTVLAAPDGRWWVNSSGNPILATAGSGDVLTGLIASLLAQGWPVEPALPAAVHLHGRAADALSTELGGESGGTAGEIADAARRIFNRWIGADDRR